MAYGGESVARRADEPVSLILTIAPNGPFGLIQRNECGKCTQVD
jgi:hypothetical protein